MAPKNKTETAAKVRKNQKINLSQAALMGRASAAQIRHRARSARLALSLADRFLHADVHIDVNHISLRIEELIPDPFDYHRLAHRPWSCHHQQLQQSKLAVSQIDYLSSSPGLMGNQV